MVYYHFDKIQKSKPTKIKGKIRRPSRIKLTGLILILMLQIIPIFYGQCQLFHRRTENKFRYVMTLAVYLLSGIINFIFNMRITTMKKENNTKTMIFTVILFTTVNICFSWFTPVGDMFPSGWVGAILTHIVTSLFLFLQLATFLRYIVVVKSAIECKMAKEDENVKKYYYLMTDAETDAGLVSFLDCYVRAVPQALFQIATVVGTYQTFTDIPILEQVPIWTSFILLPWTSTSYHKSLRKQNNSSFSFGTATLYFLWNVLILSSRLISIGAVLAFWRLYTGIGIFIHWFISTIWLYYYLKPMEFYNRSKIIHVMFCAVFGIVKIFTCVNFNKKSKLWYYSYFYLIMFIENNFSLGIWYYLQQHNSSFGNVVVIGSLVIFLLGICLMIWYYYEYHPQKNNKNDIIELVPSKVIVENETIKTSLPLSCDDI